MLDALAAGGAETRFVGGCVRDALRGVAVKDIDIATPAPPERVMALLADAGIRLIPTGIKHGTVTAVVGAMHFEITTLRVDVETDGRHATVAYTDDWLADARRRDFTINTLSSTREGDVYDPFGGLEDLSQGRVLFVGNPAERIDEDVLRLLRFFRFHATMGRPPPDPRALAACRAMAPRLRELSGERVRGELERILMTNAPADAIVLMRGQGVLEPILPEAGDVGRLRALSFLETRAIRVESVEPDAIRRLAALMDAGADGARAAAGRLRLSNRERERLVILAAPPAEIAPGMDETARRRALRKLGASVARDLVLLAWAAEVALDPHRPAERTQAWLATLAAVDAWTAPEFPLKGRDVMALGVAPGPRVGDALDAVEAWWDAGGCRAGRDACLDKLGAVVGERA